MRLPSYLVYTIVLFAGITTTRAYATKTGSCRTRLTHPSILTYEQDNTPDTATTSSQPGPLLPPTISGPNNRLIALVQCILIGMASGTLSSYTDRAHFPLFPLNWLACSCLRTLTLELVLEKQCAGIYEAYTLNKTAWLTDWITYIILKFR